METGFCDNGLYRPVLITDDYRLANARAAIGKQPKRDNLFVNNTPDTG
jgi:hypothetical protein